VENLTEKGQLLKLDPSFLAIKKAAQLRRFHIRKL